MPPVLYEKEVAILVRDIYSHLSRLEKQMKPTKTCVFPSYIGNVSVVEKPLGVCLIVCDSNNLIRYGLAPLVASIAAGNVTILATPAGAPSRAILSLQQAWGAYMDTESIFFFAEFNPSIIEIEKLDCVRIFGQCNPS